MTKERLKRYIINDEEYLNMISKSVGKNPSTIENWLKGSNGPSDIQDVKSLADFFSMDYMTFLKKVGKESMNRNLLLF